MTIEHVEFATKPDLEALVDRVKQLEAVTVGTSPELWAKLLSRVDELESRLGAVMREQVNHGEVLKCHSRELNNVAGWMGNIQPGKPPRPIFEQLAGLELRAGNIRSRLDDLEKRASVHIPPEMETRLGQLERLLMGVAPKREEASGSGGFIQRLDSFENKVRTVTADNRAISERLNSFGEGYKNDFEKTDERLKNLEGSGGRVVELANRVNGLAGRVELLERLNVEEGESEDEDPLASEKALASFFQAQRPGDWMLKKYGNGVYMFSPALGFVPPSIETLAADIREFTEGFDEDWPDQILAGFIQHAREDGAVSIASRCKQAASRFRLPLMKRNVADLLRALEGVPEPAKTDKKSQPRAAWDWTGPELADAILDAFDDAPRKKTEGAVKIGDWLEWAGEGHTLANLQTAVRHFMDAYKTNDKRRPGLKGTVAQLTEWLSTLDGDDEDEEENDSENEDAITEREGLAPMQVEELTRLRLARDLRAYVMHPNTEYGQTDKVVDFVNGVEDEDGKDWKQLGERVADFMESPRRKAVKAVGPNSTLQQLIGHLEVESL